MRAIGSTGVEVTELGFGAAPLGGLFAEVTGEQAQAALEAADKAGIRYVDTAPHYGVGLSEQRVGDFLSGTAGWVLSTKVGRLLEPGDEADLFVGAPALRRRWDFSAEGVRRSVTDSLTRLPAIDIALVHDPDDFLDEAVEEAFPALHALKAEGTIRAVGAGMNNMAPLIRIVEQAAPDCLLVAGRWNLLDRSAGQELLPLCAQRGVSVLVGGVLGSGLLADPRPGVPYRYGAASDADIGLARQMRQVCSAFAVPLLAAALRFPLRHPAVTSVLVGMRSAGEVEQATAAWQVEVPEALWAELDALWEQAQ